MFKVPLQTLFAAGLLLTLAFTVNDSSSAPGPSAPDAKVRFACDDSGKAANPERDAGGCREANFR
jgi:hypothetical protein